MDGENLSDFGIYQVPSLNNDLNLRNTDLRMGRRQRERIVQFLQNRNIRDELKYYIFYKHFILITKCIIILIHKIY